MTEKPPVTCPQCGKRFRAQFALDQHCTAMGHASSHACPTCQKTLQRNTDLRQHQAVKLHGIASAPGPKLEKEVQVKQYLNENQSDKGFSLPCTCRECNKNFGTAAALKQHHEAKGHEGMYYSPAFQKAFILRSKWKQRRKTKFKEARVGFKERIAFFNLPPRPRLPRAPPRYVFASPSQFLKECPQCHEVSLSEGIYEERGELLIIRVCHRCGFKERN